MLNAIPRVCGTLATDTHLVHLNFEFSNMMRATDKHIAESGEDFDLMGGADGKINTSI